VSKEGRREGGAKLFPKVVGPFLPAI
jgi:hypothetical protein